MVIYNQRFIAICFIIHKQILINPATWLINNILFYNQYFSPYNHFSMSNCYESAPQGRDPHLWQIARRRAGFRSHFTTYVVVIGAMWLFWYFTSGGQNSDPWPVWATLGWGIGLVFHFLGAFVFAGTNTVERQYEKMSRNRH